jgi:predicted nucleic acid-binding protein
MVLVDTSVWIRFFADREPHGETLARLIRLDEVAGHELVYGELLIGDTGGGRKLLTAYPRIPYARTVSHDRVVALVRDRNLNARGAGWIDIHLLASALEGRIELWTADPRFHVLAEELGVAYTL